MKNHKADHGRAEEPTGHLARLQREIVDLLGRLRRPPSKLRVRSGDVAVEIKWTEAGGTAQAGGAPQAAEAQPDPVPEAPGEAGGTYLTAPSVGVFYHAREPGAEPFVSVGSVVHPGQQVGIIEAMKLMIPIHAEQGGRITQVLKGNGVAVEYAEPLFALEPEEG